MYNPLYDGNIPCFFFVCHHDVDSYTRKGTQAYAPYGSINNNADLYTQKHYINAYYTRR